VSGGGAYQPGARARRARVKFWFIKNYMSPQFKRFLPHMAARYGFEYELVTYKWPSWLHKQARAQRVWLGSWRCSAAFDSARLLESGRARAG